MQLTVLLLTAFFGIFPGKNAEHTEVFLEKGTQLIAYQITGEKGKADFRYLDAGSYKLSVVFPQQSGKYTETKPKHQSLTKAIYNSRNKTYYYQGNEGYFALKFSGISKIKSENFLVVFREEEQAQKRFIVISEFGAHGKNASLQVSVRAITAARFQKASKKADTNISTISIPNIR